MKMNMYAIYDKVANDWFPPFFQKNDASALRSVEVTFCTRPEFKACDFELYKVGELEYCDSKLKVNGCKNIVINWSVNTIKEL